jgi:hypothetical protein
LDHVLLTKKEASRTVPVRTPVFGDRDPQTPILHRELPFTEASHMIIECRHVVRKNRGGVTIQATQRALELLAS